MVASKARSANSKQQSQPNVYGKKGLTSHAHFFFHLLSFCVFLYGFCWHVKVAAKFSPAVGFGHYAKYLSFWGFLCQLAALSCSLLSHLLPNVKAVEEAADDLSSAVFGYSNVVCLAYLLLRLASWTNEDSPLVARPPWLALLGTTLTAGFAWVDVLVARRTFSQRGFQICMLMAVAYVGWVHLIKAWQKVYPYPFLNRLPEPEGFIVIALSALGAMFLFFKAGLTVAGTGTKISPQSRSILLKRAKQK